MRCDTIAIVGLGLIGGSVLKALQGFRHAVFYGIDRDIRVVQEAKNQGLIVDDEMVEKDIIKNADVVFVCLPPDATISFINENSFKEDTLVTDVCGVKQAIFQQVTNRKVNFIGGHPMAGKEENGFYASEKTLFHNANYLLTPLEDSRPEHIALLKEMVTYMGCGEIVITTPAEHDMMVAYTSQLMHVVAVTLCDNKLLDDAKHFSAGSLRDCTRVAKLDSQLWSRLFLMNREALVACIDAFSDSLKKLRNFTEAENEEELVAFLESCSDRKRRFLE